MDTRENPDHCSSTETDDSSNIESALIIDTNPEPRSSSDSSEVQVIKTSINSADNDINQTTNSSRNKTRHRKTKSKSIAPMFSSSEDESSGMSIRIINNRNISIVAEKNKTYCYCDRKATLFMLCCKGCHQPFHLECCALAENDAKKYPFYCETCKPERTYKVEAIRGMKITPNGRMFLIKWVGYEKMTYEIEDDLKDCISIVNAYLVSHNRPKSKFPEDTRVGAIDENVNKNDWMEISEVIVETQHLIKRMNLSPLNISEFAETATSDCIQFTRYINHCYVLLFLAEQKLYILGDGENNFIEDESIKSVILSRVKARIHPVRFLQQLGDSHCGTSAVLIAIELIKLYKAPGWRQIWPDTITVSNYVLSRLRRKYHKETHISISGKPNIAEWPVFKCQFCDYSKRSKLKTMAHERMCKFQNPPICPDI